MAESYCRDCGAWSDLNVRLCTKHAAVDRLAQVLFETAIDRHMAVCPKSAANYFVDCSSAKCVRIRALLDEIKEEK